MRDPRLSRPRGARHPPPPQLEEMEQARALGRKTALADPGPAPVDRVEELLRYARLEVWSAFFESFAAAASENDTRWSAWLRALTSEVARAATDLHALSLSPATHAAQMMAAARAWEKEPNPLSVWSRRYGGDLPFSGRALFLYLRLLLLLDPSAWCEAIDRLPWPGLMKHAIFLHGVAGDRALLIELLRVAPPAFDAEGRWAASRSVVALLLAEQIVQHALELHKAVSHEAREPPPADATDRTSPESELRALEDEELPGWMHEAFTVLLARPDGRAIALALLGHLGRVMLLGRSRWPRKGFWAEQQALHELAAVLRAGGVGVHDVRHAWALAEASAREEHARREENNELRPAHSHRTSEDEGEGARTLRGEGLPFLLGATLLLGLDQSSTDGLAVFWGWFEELLVGRDPGLSLVQHGSSMTDVPARIGSLIARAGDPGAFVRATYTRLEPQRRRSAFAYRYEDYDHDLGSRLLIRIGLYAAANWAAREGEEGKEPARRLFFWLYEAARRLWLTLTDRLDSERRDLVTLTFAFMPIIFGDALGVALRRAVPPIANEDRMICDAAWFLWQNKVPPERLPELLRDAGADLEAALRDAHQWAALTETRARPGDEWAEDNRAFPATLEHLAAALQLTLGELATTPPESARAQRRAHLARRIPWGAALLDRLTQDGCALSRIEPLDAGAATWLLQASVPSPLRARFGLSAEIRVLVVYGQVRGRELRTALQDPRDASKVDSDLLVVASDQPDLARRLPMLAGPFGQRVPWPPAEGRWAPLADTLRDYLPGFDLFDYRDPVRGAALIGRQAEVDDLAARLLRGEAVGVIGLRKVGKSSLLRAVADKLDPIGARRGMFESLSVPLPEAEPEALVVSLDVQGVAGRGLSVLLDRLCVVLADRLSLAASADNRETRDGAASTGALLPGQIRVANETEGEPLGRALLDTAALDPMDRFRNLLELSLHRTALPVCFILDEYDLLFEGYGGEPGMVGIERLLSLLRAEAQATRRVSLALIGRDPSFLDKPLLGGFTSPLAGWAKHLYLGPLRREGMEELLTRLGRRVGLDVGPATLADAWLWTGGHPLLARQYGAALFDLAHAPPSRPRPVPTDPIHKDAGEVFLARAAVQTICTEVLALLEARFPEALALLAAIARSPASTTGALGTHPRAERARGSQVLARFGLLREDPEGWWIPGAFRDAFAASSRGPEAMSRSASR